jgi:Putative peptidoglycan binding domain
MKQFVCLRPCYFVITTICLSIALFIGKAAEPSSDGGCKTKEVHNPVANLFASRSRSTSILALVLTMLYKKRKSIKREVQDVIVGVLRLICLIGVLSSVACSCQSEPPLLPSARYNADPSAVRAVQIALRNRHYYKGATDGFLGEETGIAIQLFQMDHCLRVKPLVDRSLLIALDIANKLPISRKVISR